MLIVGAASIQHRIHYNDAARNSAAYARDAQNQIAAECGVPFANPSCARKIEQTRRANQREEYDLYSQQVMALWTAVVGAMAAIGIGLSGVGVYLIWRTWDATREAADNSRKTLDSYIGRERAQLRLGDAYYQFLDDSPAPHGFRAEIRNHGAGPGDVVSISWEYLHSPGWPHSAALRHEVWVDDISTAAEPISSTHLGTKNLAQKTWWLAVKLEYRTLGKRRCQTFKGYKIEYIPIDEYGEGGFRATKWRLSAQPRNT